MVILYTKKIILKSLQLDYKMYFVDIKKKVQKFINSLENSSEINKKLKLLEDFKSNEKIYLDIEKLKGKGKKFEFYRVRIGEVRFVFQVLKKEKIIWIKFADYRGRIYK